MSGWLLTMLPRMPKHWLGSAILAFSVVISAIAWGSGGWHRYWRELATSTFVQVGTGKTTVYDFFDPNCPYCAQSFETELPFVQSGKLTVRFIPVGALTPSSFGKAAAILESKDPAQALDTDLIGVLRYDTGGIEGVQPTPAVRRALDRNLALLQQTGADLVPDLVFRLPDGHVGLIRGAFPKMALDRLIRGQMP